MASPEGLWEPERKKVVGSGRGPGQESGIGQVNLYGWSRGSVEQESEIRS